MTKSLPSKLHLKQRPFFGEFKQRLYSHHLTEGTSLENHLTVFKEIVSYLESLEVK